jgi:hypothetical protein
LRRFAAMVENAAMLKAKQIAMVVLVWLAAGLGPARADCVSECQSATYCDSEMNASGECSQRLNDCYIDRCNQTLYGALAYDTGTGAVGWSYDFADQAGAEQKALSGCSAHGNSCKVVYDFWNSCAALAVADDGSYAVGRGETEDQANDEAIIACSETGQNCSVQAWSCTGP